LAAAAAKQLPGWTRKVPKAKAKDERPDTGRVPQFEVPFFFGKLGKCRE